MIVAGIDPSLTSTGVAVLVDGRPARYSRHGRPGHNGASYQSRSRRIRKLCADVVAAVGRPDLVVIEEHPYAVRISGSEFDRSAVWHGIFGNLDAHEIPIAVVGNTTAKHWVTGSGRADKQTIVDTINEWYGDQLPEPLDVKTGDDIADAFGLATIGAFRLGEPMPFDVVKQRHSLALDMVDWPELAIA